MKNDPVGYVTVRTPYGRGEEFIIPEILAVGRHGQEVVVFPRSPTRTLAPAGRALEKATYARSPLSMTTLLSAWRQIRRKRSAVIRVLFKVVVHSGSIANAFRNLVAFPQALLLTDLVEARGMRHVHAHWGTTPATLAYVSHELTGVPWSVTLHRGDITQNNMLQEKARTALFVRCVFQGGKLMANQHIPRHSQSKIRVIRMGVAVGPPVIASPTRNPALIVIPASLLPVKGHRYLVEAATLLRQWGVSVRLRFLGEGPLRADLERQVAAANLTDVVEMLGVVDHDELLALYRSDTVFAVVLPSVLTRDGQHEGVPVALMEAMEAGIPVIATETGGIPELIGNGAGIIVPPEDPIALAHAIQRLSNDSDLYAEVSRAGRRRIESEYDVDRIADQLLVAMDDDAPVSFMASDVAVETP